MKEIWQSEKVIQQSNLILESYRHWKGQELFSGIASPQDGAKHLFLAPFVVVSHGTESDPVLNYGNQRALDLWEMTWDSFIQTPSRLTAEITVRQERSELLAQVNRDGFSDNYNGIRISSSGRRFRIESATVWNLIDPSGILSGQAACFEHYTFID